ncbi:MAG: ABC transporter ATP-binding protein [Candidatus Bathyarchaeia archaeon]
MTETLLKVEKLKKWFPITRGLLRSLFSRRELYVRAVDDIDFEIKEREIFGLVGESGSGKTTTGRMLVRLIEPTSGKILYRGKDIVSMSDEEFKPFRKKLQMIFQDPYESLNPKMTVFDILAEPLRVQNVAHGDDLYEMVCKILEDVELTPPEEFLHRYPHELSGGQRQRVATGRALILNPEFIVADEPVSMLDVSIRAEVLNLMVQLRDMHGIAFLYITHDLALARHLCDNIAVMYLGKIMELTSADRLIKEPLHPYTKALLTAVPVPDPTSRRAEITIKGEIPSPVNPPSGCRFHTRCPQFIGEICKRETPPLVDVGSRHYVACHLYS